MRRQLRTRSRPEMLTAPQRCISATSGWRGSLRAEDLGSAASSAVPLVDLFDGHDRQQLVPGVAQRDLVVEATAASGSTGSVTGIGKSVPSARRISASDSP